MRLPAFLILWISTANFAHADGFLTAHLHPHGEIITGTQIVAAVAAAILAAATIRLIGRRT
jgi:hypothetical protein